MLEENYLLGTFQVKKFLNGSFIYFYPDKKANYSNMRKIAFACVALMPLTPTKQILQRCSDVDTRGRYSFRRPFFLAVTATPAHLDSVEQEAHPKHF